MTPYYFKRALIFIFLSLHGAISIAHNNFKDVTILVSSCYKYAPLWDPFFGSLFKQWPSLLAENKDVPILLISNNKSFKNQRVETIHIRQERSWSDNMIHALQQVQTQYVLIMLDDYWLVEPVQEQRLHDIMQVMQQEKVSMAQLSYNNPDFHYGLKHPSLSNAIYTNKYAPYKASLQIAIWDKNALKFLLKSDESPWDFEIEGTARSHGYPGVFINIAQNYPMIYLNAARQGHIEQFAIDYARDQDLPLDLGNLPVVDKYNIRVTLEKAKRHVTKLWNTWVVL